ncbi:MAG: hypothetical protein IJ998_05170 [Alistipes sp.]|nr:hypothetical protein [Alistipes sp.]
MAASAFKIYTIEGIDYDAVIAKYRQICIEGEWEFDVNTISVYGNIEPKRIQTREPRNPLKDDTKIKRKAIYLVHTIAYRQVTNRDNSSDGVTIRTKLLQDVIYEDYYELVKALEQLGYIKVSPYIVGKSSRRYKIIGNITSTESSDKTIGDYIDKAKKLLKEAVLERMVTPEFKALYGDKFAETYIKNLNKFKIKDKTGLDSYINEQIASTPSKESYYNFIKESFKKDFKIYSIDDNNRIYHLLTSLERELKQFINIKYSIDCKNSHPVLFNYFIFNYKGIDIETSYLISSILYSIDKSLIFSNNHYDIEKLCNILINNNIEKSIITKFAPDELLYIYKTTKGLFWDDILKEHQGEGLDRAEIKEKMFAEVFYSKTKKLSWKVFAKEFKAQYPNVYHLIEQWKEPLKNEILKGILLDKKRAVELGDMTLMQNQETALPNFMMMMESEIFREVLKSLFRKRIKAVHIHDAIVLPQTRAVVDVNKIEEVMRSAYKHFGLHPTFSIDKYE